MIAMTRRVEELGLFGSTSMGIVILLAWGSVEIFE